MSQSPTLSLCMIAKNEAAWLERCLNSVSGLVDEMIVVDTGSTDDTAAIARRCGARVEPFDWISDFSAARNESLRCATGDWILVLDADEVLDEAAGPALRKLITAGQADGYQLIQRSLLPPGNIRRYSDLLITRLFRNRAAYRYQQPIHEQIQPAILAAGGVVEPTEGVIWHYGYAQGTAQGSESRAARNLQVLEEALRQSPADPYLVYHLGITHKALGNSAAAHAALEQARALDGGRLPPAAREDLLLKLAQLALAADDFAAAASHAAGCLQLNPGNVIARYVSALALLYQGQFEPAVAAFSQVRRAPDLDPAEIANIEAVLAWCREQVR